MKIVLRFLKPYKTKILLVILCMAAEAAGGLLIPTVTADIINTGIAGGDLGCILRRGGLMLVIAAAAAAAALGASYTAAAFSASFGRDLRCAVYDKTLTFSADDAEHFGTGTLITRTLSDVSIVQQTTVMLLQGILPVPLVCAAGIFLAFRIDRTAGFLLLGLTALILAASVLVMRRTTPLFEKQQRFLDRMNLSVRESITGVRVVRAFNKEAAEAKRLGGIFDGYRGVSIRANRMFAGLDCTLMLIINLVTVAILWLGGNRTGAGLMEIGDISALSQYAAMILFYLLMAQFTLIMIPRAVVCAGRLAEILNRTPAITDPAAPSTAQTGGDEVLRFRHVNFRRGLCLPPRGDRGDRGQHGQRQIHRGKAGAPLPRRDGRRGGLLRHGRAQPDAERPAPPHRLCAAAGMALCRNGGVQPPERCARRGCRRDAPCAHGGAGGLHHRRRGRTCAPRLAGRHQLLGRTAPAAGDRPRADEARRPLYL